MTGAVRLNEKRLYRVMDAGILACIGLIGGAQVLGIPEVSWAWRAAAVLAFGLFAAVDFLKTREKMLCVLAAAVCLWALVAFAGVSESLLFLRAFWAWLWGNGEVYEQWQMGFQVLTASVIAAAAYLAELFLERLPVLKPIFAGLLAAGLLYCLFARIRLPHLGVVFLLGYLVTVYVEWSQKRWERVRGQGDRAHMLWVMPFLALYLLLMAGTSAPEEPYGWPWVDSIYQRLRETFLVYSQKISWGGREGFGLAFSGFSEDGSLGGDLHQEKREVMTVRIKGDTVENVYLTGKVYDAFDGRQWEQTDSGSPLGMLLDTAQTKCAVREYNRQYQRDYMKELELDIRYAYFNTRFLFAPLKTWMVEGDGKGFDYEDVAGSLSFRKHKGYGTEYRLQYYRLNTGQEEFYRFLEEAAGDGQLDQAVLEEMGRWEKDSGETATSETLETWRRGIYEKYLGEPSLSRQAADYLSEMTKGARTDIERLRAIERELSSYTYSRTPGNLPGDISDEEAFLDYFLLESREGYCTYFATAFVLLARASGIPARYVEGFCVPVEEKAEVAVYSDMAHAWPEVYLSGVGWIPFEPTPGYGEVRHVSWDLRQPMEELPKEEAQRPVTGQGKKEEGKPWAEPQEEEEEAAEEEPPESAEGRYWGMAAIVLLTVFAAWAAALVLNHGLGRYRYKRMGLEEKFRAEVHRNLRILAMLGLARAEHETLQELRERGQKKEGLTDRVNRGDLLLFLENYENITYGTGAVTEEMLEEAVSEGRAYLACLRRERKWAYVYYRLHPWGLL